MRFKKINKLSSPLPGMNVSKPIKLYETPIERSVKNWVDYETRIMASDMQRFEEATKKINENSLGNYVSVKKFGAIGDGIADDTYAFAKAFETLPKYSTLFVPSGIYKGNFIFQFHQVIGEGDTTFIALDINKPIITLRDPTGWDYQTFRDCKIDGKNQAKTLIQFGIDFNDRYAGRWIIKNISLNNSADIGVKKPGGNIGVHWEECDFNDNPIQYYAHNESGKVMHVGCDTFYKCHFSGATKAVWYYKENDNTGKEEGGQIIIRDCIAEGNNNAAVLIADNFGKGCVPIVIENLWLEQNSKAPNTMVNINGKNYKARELHIENVGRFKISGTYIHSSYFKNSNAVIDNCEISDSYMGQNYFKYNEGVQLENDNSNITLYNSYTRCGWSQVDNDKTPITVRNHQSETSYVTKGLLGYYSSQPNNIPSKKGSAIPIYVNKLDSIDKAIQFEGNRIIAKEVADGIMTNKCLEFEAVVAGSWTHRVLTPMLSNFLGKYIVMTFSIKPLTTNDKAVLMISGGSGDLGELRFKKTGEWNHYRLCFYVSGAYSQHGNLGLWFNESPVGFKFRMTNLQVLAFDNLNEANAFIDNGYFLDEETDDKEIQTLNYTKYELSNTKVRVNTKISYHKRSLEWTGGSEPYGHMQISEVVDEDTGETLTKYRIPEPNAYIFRPYIFNSGDNQKWCLFRVELKFLNLNESRDFQIHSGSGNIKSGTIRYKSTDSGVWRTYYSITKIRDDMTTHPFNTGFYFTELPVGTEFLVRSYTMAMFDSKQDAINVMNNNLIMI